MTSWTKGRELGGLDKLFWGLLSTVAAMLKADAFFISP
jgi:hypothetical protein